MLLEDRRLRHGLVSRRRIVPAAPSKGLPNAHAARPHQWLLWSPSGIWRRTERSASGADLRSRRGDMTYARAVAAVATLGLLATLAVGLAEAQSQTAELEDLRAE